MTPDVFAANCKKSLHTVQNWISKGYIPGANAKSVPDSAREPYTSARAKKVSALMKSILKACCDGKGIVPGLFGITEEQFDACLQYLEREGYVYKHEADGITYYDGTIKGSDALNSFKKSDWISLIGAGSTLIPAILQVAGILK